ncbi:MAG: MBL fold metallo-hydrolase [Anaerolineaceae bacterium]|nr:MBL fold metallo-hydrolase [Anaerolineaceae bacterium]
MKLKWYGQACFLITADDGTMIVTDPYTPETAGYCPVEEAPDIVIRSSDNDDFHCRADLVPGEPEVLTALDVARAGGEQDSHGINFHCIESMEALDHRFHDPDANGMYRFDVDGVSIGHMGDVGNPLTDAQIDFFRDLDVLLALTGGHPTIELDDLMTVIRVAQPKLVVPMHFRTLSYRPRGIYWISSFLELFNEEEEVDFALDYEAVITQGSLPDSTRVLVLDYVK